MCQTLQSLPASACSLAYLCMRSRAAAPRSVPPPSSAPAPHSQCTHLPLVHSVTSLGASVYCMAVMSSAVTVSAILLSLGLLFCRRQPLQRVRGKLSLLPQEGR